MTLDSHDDAAPGLLFFASCGALIVDVVASVPERAPWLGWLVPMFVAVAWAVRIEHRRARAGTDA